VPSPTELYPLVALWLQALEVTGHPTARAALSHLVTALLVGQSLRSTALMRALLSPEPVPARQRYKRVARAWGRRWLSPAWLTPRLVGAALALVGPDPAGRPTAGLTHLALDSVRCGPWELFTLGVAWHGRVLVVGWAVLPYPWPKGRFTPAVGALVARVAAAWPPDRPAHLVADRAFPSHALFRALRRAGWGWTVRLRATLPVTVDGQGRTVREQRGRARLNGWTAAAAGYGSGPGAVPGLLVVGRGLAVVPGHQGGPASLARRAGRHARRQRHLAGKHPRQRPDASPQTDAWVALFSTHADRLAATTSYGRRWATEGSYRDGQGGWDGRHGWGLEPSVARLADPAAVGGVVGLWALGTLVQSWVGDQAGHPAAPAPVRAARGEWTTTGRLSVWARGRLALTEPSGRLRPWLHATLTAGAGLVAAATPAPAPAVPRPLRVPPAPGQQVA
jgi:hypothetical protein